MQTIKLFKELITRFKDYPRLEKEFSILDNNYNLLNKSYSLLNKVVERKRKQLLTLSKENQLLNLQISSSKKKKGKKLNERFTHKTVYYSAPKRKKVIEYVKDEHYTLVSGIANVLIGKHNLSSDSQDEVPLVVMKWVNSKFKDKTLIYRNEVKEDWGNPENSFDKKYVDCDNVGILEYYLIREIFKKLGTWSKVKHKLWCVCSNVNTFSMIPSPFGSHFYLIWEHDDLSLSVVETTYYREKAIINWGRKDIRDNPAYGTIWFLFNEEKSFRTHKL